MGTQLTKNFDVDRQPTTLGGTSSHWKIFKARRKDASGTPVSVFMFDKRSIQKQRDKQQIINWLKAQPTALVRLRHPTILQIVEPLLQDKNSLAFVTEPVQHCLGDLLRHPQKMKATLCDIQIRLGILQIIQALSFLHTEVRTVHFSVCPDNIYISPQGKWKLAGIGFGSPLNQDQIAFFDQQADLILAAKNFRYDSSIVSPFPLLNYTAHEVLDLKKGTVATDVFSLGCSLYSIYHVLKCDSIQVSYMNVDEFSVMGHRSACGAIGRSPYVNMSYLPQNLSEQVQKMTTMTAQNRSSLHELSVSQAFQSPFVRAIYYLEHLHQKQDSQKLQFFQGLTKIIERFDSFIMQKRLLPALIQNIHHPSLSIHILPNLFIIIRALNIGRDYFQRHVWTALQKLTSAKEIPAQSFYLILSEIDLLISLSEEDQWKRSLMPIVSKGFDCGVAQIQMILMEKTPSMIKQVHDAIYMRTQILPKFLGGILNTKSSSVRQTGLKSLSEIFPIFDRSTIVDLILPSLQKFRRLDITGPVLMNLIDVYQNISKTLGHRVTAVNLIPVISPLLVDGELDRQEFTRLAQTLENMLQEVKKARLIEIADYRPPVKQEEVQLEIEKKESRLEIDDKPDDIFNNLFAQEPVVKAPVSKVQSNPTDIFGQSAQGVKLPQPPRQPVGISKEVSSMFQTGPIPEQARPVQTSYFSGMQQIKKPAEFGGFQSIQSKTNEQPLQYGSAINFPNQISAAQKTSFSPSFQQTFSVQNPVNSQSAFSQSSFQGSFQTSFQQKQQPMFQPPFNNQPNLNIGSNPFEQMEDPFANLQKMQNPNTLNFQSPSSFQMNFGNQPSFGGPDWNLNSNPSQNLSPNFLSNSEDPFAGL